MDRVAVKNRLNELFIILENESNGTWGWVLMQFIVKWDFYTILLDRKIKWLKNIENINSKDWFIDWTK